MTREASAAPAVPTAVCLVLLLCSFANSASAIEGAVASVNSGSGSHSDKVTEFVKILQTADALVGRPVAREEQKHDPASPMAATRRRTAFQTRRRRSAERLAGWGLSSKGSTRMILRAAASSAGAVFILWKLGNFFMTCLLQAQGPEQHPGSTSRALSESDEHLGLCSQVGLGRPPYPQEGEPPPYEVEPLLGAQPASVSHGDGPLLYEGEPPPYEDYEPTDERAATPHEHVPNSYSDVPPAYIEVPPPYTDESPPAYDDIPPLQPFLSFFSLENLYRAARRASLMRRWVLSGLIAAVVGLLVLLAVGTACAFLYGKELEKELQPSTRWLASRLSALQSIVTLKKTPQGSLTALLSSLKRIGAGEPFGTSQPIHVEQRRQELRALLFEELTVTDSKGWYTSGTLGGYARRVVRRGIGWDLLRQETEALAVGFSLPGMEDLPPDRKDLWFRLLFYLTRGWDDGISSLCQQRGGKRGHAKQVGNARGKAEGGEAEIPPAERAMLGLVFRAWVDRVPLRYRNKTQANQLPAGTPGGG